MPLYCRCSVAVRRPIWRFIEKARFINDDNDDDRIGSRQCLQDIRYAFNSSRTPSQSHFARASRCWTASEWLPRLLLPLATHFCAEDHSSTPLCKQVRADVALDAPNSASSVGFIPGKRWYKLPERKQY